MYSNESVGTRMEPSGTPGLIAYSCKKTFHPEPPKVLCY